MIAVFAGSSSSNTARTVSGLLGFVCFIVLVVAAVLIWVGIEFTKCKQWARITLIVVYTLSAVSSLTRLMAGGTVATGILIDIVMLMLLFAPSTARDFSPHQYVGGWAPQRVPGWYPDPSGSPQQRYWNGTSWTEHVHQG